MFQVSETFGGDLEQILKKEDISCKSTMRPNDIDAPPREMFAAPKDMLPAPRRRAAAPMYRALHRRLMAGNIMKRLELLFAFIASLFSMGASIAGVAACNVM